MLLSKLLKYLSRINQNVLRKTEILYLVLEDKVGKFCPFLISREEDKET